MNYENAVKRLVKIADELDIDGKTELAQAVDETIVSLAARPKSSKPLKKMEEKQKDELFKFLACVCEDMHNSTKALEELMRRLRYFGVDGEVKGLKLADTHDKVKELAEVINKATHKMHEMAFGKKMSKEYLKSLKDKEQDANDPFSFARNSDDSQKEDREKLIKMNELMKEFKADGGIGRSGMEMIDFFSERIPELKKNEIHEFLMRMGYLPRPKSREVEKFEPTAEEMKEFWGGEEPESFEDNAEDGQDA